MSLDGPRNNEPAPAAPGADQAGDRQPGSEATLTLCLFCSTQIEAVRKGRQRLFCKAAHRVAYRDSQIQASIRMALSGMAEASAELDRLTALLNGSAALLARYQRGEKRKRKDLTRPETLT